MNNDNENESKRGNFARNVEEGFKNVWRPDFNGDATGKKDDKRSGDVAQGAEQTLNDAEKKAKEVAKSATDKLGGLYKNGAASLKEGEEKPGGFHYTETGKRGKGKTGKSKIMKASVGLIIFLVVLVGVAVVALGTPIFQIGTIDFNLMDALGFTGTVGILEKQAEYVIEDEMAHGKVPDELAGKLAAHGLMVGQVASNGDFVRTNVYVANADELKDLAVLGNFQVQESQGELAILYDDKVIRASEFAKTVEANPVMYAAYSEAIDIGALYYYGKDAEEALKDAGVSRSMFADWEDTGNAETNQENFDKIAEKSLNGKSDLTVGGYTGASEATSKVDSSEMRLAVEPRDTDGDRGNVVSPEERNNPEPVNNDSAGGSSVATPTAEGVEASLSNSDDASSIINEVAGKITDDTQEVATAKAAQLLNSAVSASEPYLAAKTFMFIESPIQRTRIEGKGPIAELFTAMQKESEVEVSTGGETKKVTASILTDPNFVAAVSSGKYSKSDAAYFSRDAILLATNTGSNGIIHDTTVATEGQKKSDIVLGMGTSVSANEDALKVANGAISLAMVEKGSDLFSSYVGGEWAVEGGGEVSNMINRKAVGAMGSDAPTLTLYNKEVDDVLARKAEAERATKSPFDISSPYTFMGSLARKLSVAILRGNATMKAGGGAGSVVGTIANMTGDSVNGLFGSAMADGVNDGFGMTFGDHCKTVNSAASVEGNIYCSEQSSISLMHMDWGQDEWGKMGEKEGYKKYVLTGMDRMATIGVKSADVCKKYNEEYGGIINNLLGFLGIYKDCDGVDDDIATGARNTFSSDNKNREKAEEYGAFARYDQVVSLLEGSSTAAARIREEYYAKHPQDNSKAGKLARISGMTKSEAEVALAYADYLTYIAKYDPSTRYAFGKLEFEKPAGPLVEHAGQVAVDLYAIWHGRTEYDDLRGRIRVG